MSLHFHYKHQILLQIITLFFSNNKNQFFSIDIKQVVLIGKIKLIQIKITIIGNYLFTISLEGYLLLLEKNTGNIIRVTDVFNNFKKKKKYKPTGLLLV